jgi:hypothetical protein
MYMTNGASPHSPASVENIQKVDLDDSDHERSAETALDGVS